MAGVRWSSHPAAADDALGVSEQDNLQEHGGWISRCTGCIVAEAGIETREIGLVVEQMIHGMLKGVGQTAVVAGQRREIGGLVSMCL